MFVKNILILSALIFATPLLPASENKITPLSRLDEVSVIKSLIDPKTIREVVENHYLLEGPLKVSLLNTGINDMYLVEAGDRKYVLRLSRVEKYERLSESEFLFELEWLDFLQKEGVPVSYPIRRLDNRLCGLIEAPEGPRYITLFSYAEGTTDIDLDQAFIFGKTLARMHSVSDQFETTFDRPHLDIQNLIDRPIQKIKEFLGERDEKCAYLDVIGEELRRKISKLEGSYGIIAGDVHGFNQHFTPDNQVTLFDFEFCAYGYRIYDLATFRWCRGSDNIELWHDFYDIQGITPWQRWSLAAIAMGSCGLSKQQSVILPLAEREAKERRQRGEISYPPFDRLTSRFPHLAKIYGSTHTCLPLLAQLQL